MPNNVEETWGMLNNIKDYYYYYWVIRDLEKMTDFEKCSIMFKKLWGMSKFYFIYLFWVKKVVKKMPKYNMVVRKMLGIVGNATKTLDNVKKMLGKPKTLKTAKKRSFQTQKINYC